MAISAGRVARLGECSLSTEILKVLKQWPFLSSVLAGFGIAAAFELVALGERRSLVSAAVAVFLISAVILTALTFVFAWVMSGVIGLPGFPSPSDEWIVHLVGGIGIWSGYQQMARQAVGSGQDIGIVIGPTPLFPIWGAALAVAMLACYSQRRGLCRVCGRGATRGGLPVAGSCWSQPPARTILVDLPGMADSSARAGWAAAE